MEGMQIQYPLVSLETDKESRKNQNFHFDLQIPPTLLNGTYLVLTLPYDWIYIYKGPKVKTSKM